MSNNNRSVSVGVRLGTSRSTSDRTRERSRYVGLEGQGCGRVTGRCICRGRVTGHRLFRLVCLTWFHTLVWTTEGPDLDLAVPVVTSLFEWYAPTDFRVGVHEFLKRETRRGVLLASEWVLEFVQPTSRPCPHEEWRGCSVDSCPTLSMVERTPSLYCSQNQWSTAGVRHRSRPYERGDGRGPMYTSR